MYDVIIIGKGPAGISASLYTLRASLNTLIISKNDSVLGKAKKIENYYGFEHPISGEKLLDEGEKQSLRLGAQIIHDEVIKIEKTDVFKVSTPTNTYRCSAVLLATGQKTEQIKIENLSAFEGKGVSYCSTCDGFFYKNLKVGVLGFKDYAIHEAMELKAYTNNITLYTNGNEPSVSEEFKNYLTNFKINKKKVLKLMGDEFLQKLYFDDQTYEDIDGIFVAYDTASSVDFARKLGIIIENNSVVVDSNQETNLKGVFAAGDCTGGFKQISTAVGQGAIAGKKIIDYIRSIKN